MKILFGDFDKNNDGQITAEQFKRNIFVLCPNLNMDEAELVIKAYTAPLGFNYRELDCHCSDINLPPTEDSSKFGRMKKSDDTITVSERLCNETVQVRCEHMVEGACDTREKARETCERATLKACR